LARQLPAGRARSNPLDPVSAAARNPAMKVVDLERAVKRRTEMPVGMLLSPL
jgi:hypothetical protein